jgi:hypothetical protein
LRKKKRRKKRRDNVKVLLKTEKWFNKTVKGSVLCCVEEWESETSERETEGIQCQ